MSDDFQKNIQDWVQLDNEIKRTNKCKNLKTPKTTFLIKLWHMLMNII